MIDASRSGSNWGNNVLAKVKHARRECGVITVGCVAVEAKCGEPAQSNTSVLSRDRYEQQRSIHGGCGSSISDGGDVISIFLVETNGKHLGDLLNGRMSK